MRFSVNLAGIAPRRLATYTSIVFRTAIIALSLFSWPVALCAHESSSARYTNLSGTGGGTVAAAVSVRAMAPRAVEAPPKLIARKAGLEEVKPAPRAAAAPIGADPVSPGAKTWPTAVGLALAAAAVLAARRRARSRRRVDDETLALAAHELQSPLAAIESYLDLMASEAPAATKEARRWLEDLSRMRTTTSHLRRTITDILDMTHVEDGRMKLSARPVDLAALVGDSVSAYAAHAASRGVMLRAQVMPGLAPALADPDRLRQVLDNLIGNAIKFTPSGRSVEVSARQTSGEVVLEVRDEGVGVPVALRANLFGKFQRMGPAVDGTEGTGLGLYLSRRLATAQGGKLDYEARTTGGSIFIVTMPRS